MTFTLALAYKAAALRDSVETFRVSRSGWRISYRAFLSAFCLDR
jgi:hypothetical protein